MKRTVIPMTHVLLALFCGIAGAQTEPAGTPQLLLQSFDLSRDHSLEVQYFTMESRMVTHAPDGKPVDTMVFRLRLKCVPGAAAGIEGDQYTCLGFTVQHGEADEVAIPSLAGWTYVFKHRPGGKDESGQTLGIDHGPFEKLVDARGNALQPGVAYHVYNAFIDFHSFQIFSDRTATGHGIQDLTRIGHKIVHAASHSKAATNLGGMFTEGSYFQNGEVTLELKGLGLVDGRACALVGYDSGASSFVMLMKPVPNVEVRTEGSSHYWGDIYKDLASGWVRKATLTELVVSETVLPNSPKPMDAVIERSILVRNVGPEGAETSSR
jgi:hypothetical protein